MLELIKFGSSVRATQATASNDTSSRSHAICTIEIFEIVDDGSSHGKKISGGKLLLVDLAGSERAQDTESNNKQRRKEGAEINQSLLALKECVRAMDSKSSHLPFRQSKLTMALRESFTAGKDKSRLIMLACVSPNKSSADHTLNTLRYAERLKDRQGQASQSVTSKYMVKESKKAQNPELRKENRSQVSIQPDDGNNAEGLG